MVPQNIARNSQSVVPMAKVNYWEQELALVFVRHLGQYNPNPLLGVPKHYYNISKN